MTALCFGGLVGCGGSLPEAADPKAGESALRSALESWQSGKTVESLREDRPPIWFNEPEWVAGNRLLGFTVVEPVTPYGRQFRCAVKLSLQRKDGGAKYDKRIGYQIETNPQIVIAREGL